MRVILRSFADFFKDDGPMRAGAISCFFILAFVPFVLLMVSILGYVLGEYSEFHRFLLKLLSGLFPSVTHQITTELGTIVGNRQIGIFTLLVYCLFSLELFFSIENAVQAMFEVKVKRSFFKSLALSFCVGTMLVVFTFVSFASTWLIHVVEAFSRFLPGLKIGWVTSLFTGFIAPMLVVFVVCTLLYAVLPSRRVLRHAILGGAFATVLLEAAKFLFTFYIAWRVFRLGAVYGSLTAIVVFLLWVFYACSIFLIGAKLVYNLGRLKK